MRGRDVCSHRKILGSNLPDLLADVRTQRGVPRGWTAKRHIECSVAVDRRLDRCNRERILDRSPQGLKAAPTYSKIKPWQRDIKVPQNASLAYAKYEPMPAGRNMLFPPSVVRIPAVPCCRRSAPCGAASSTRRLQRQKLGQTCPVLALKSWWVTATAP
jgi:hypothetical protein